MKVLLSAALMLILSACGAHIPRNPDQTYEHKLHNKAELARACPKITSDYLAMHGVDGFKRRNAAHNGIDMPVPTGTEVLAADQGQVIAAGYNPCGGNMVWIEHQRNKAGNKVLSGYLHLSKIDVTIGENLTQGQAIGLSGISGACNGGVPHLHFETKVGDDTLEPIKLGGENQTWPFNVGAISPHGFWASSFEGEIAHINAKTNQINKKSDGFTFPLKCNL